MAWIKKNAIITIIILAVLAAPVTILIVWLVRHVSKKAAGKIAHVIDKAAGETSGGAPGPAAGSVSAAHAAAIHKES